MQQTRAEEKNRHSGSIIENTIRILDAEDHLSTLKKARSSYGSDRDEQLFSVAMELGITWMNRILFLKLLEAQLFRYHRKDGRFKFLNYDTIDGLDELNKLFFQVLARKEKDRSADVNEKFGHIPFLNSSLFDVSSLEHQTTRISGLDDHAEIPVYSKSVLSDYRGETLNTLDYLFRFLEAYDFSVEGSEEIRDESKSLINASVLGLIFEKINGYKDGSFYTPGFITEYMARETLEKSVSDNFSKELGHEGDEPISFTDIYNRIGRDISIEKANELINSITICDPAVGSGHFLVSCLNELIAIKSELGILADDGGKLLRGVSVEVENDELIITYGETLYEYDVSHTWSGNRMISRKVDPEKQRIQKTLFHEKRHLIENCLFGVDINPNSVKICRLRLWIELLKRAYYTGRTDHMELEVLPNIDINIKQGNSLVSRFELDADLSTVFKDSEHSLDDYKQAVSSYKQTGDRREKARLQELIDNIKDEYSITLTNLRPINQKLSKARGRLEIMRRDDLFGEVKFTKKEIKKQQKKLKKLEEQKAEEESGAFYNQAFEWRFEFPEVLDDDGRFTGFDVVIGNPPYGRYNMFTNEERAYLKDRGCYGSTGDIAEVFINFVIDDLSNENTQLSFIVPKGLSYVKSWGAIREKMLIHARIFSIIDTSRAFDEALYEMLIFHIDKNENQSEKIRTGYLSNTKKELFYVPSTRYSKEIFYLGFPEEYFPILEKINDNSTYLSNHYEFWYGKGGMTPKVNKEGKGIKVLTGKEIQRYFFKDIKKKWYLEKSEINEDDLIRSKKTKVVAQDIVAHIQNPKPHIKLTATIDEDKQFCLNTVMCFSEKEEKELSNQFLTGLINSKLMSFYFYYFIFNQAIRTMHFMPGYADRLPIHKNSKLFHNDIREKVSEVLKVKNQNPEADTTELEAEIDRLLYELYGLSEEEIGIVEDEI